MNLVSSVKWSFLAELANKAIQPLVFIILARILTPDDFGIVAAAMLIIAFTQIFWEAGLGKAIIQLEGDIQEAASVAFFANASLASLMALLLIVFASDLAQFVSQDPTAESIIKVMSLQVILGGLGSIHVALLQREFFFKKLFWVRFATVSLPGLVSIPLAITGWGYWSLVVGLVAGQLVQLAILWVLSPWRPTMNCDPRNVWNIFQFGGWASLSALLMWFYVWADILFIGYFLGVHELGIYRVGNQSVMMVFALIFGPLVPVLYSFLARAQGEPLVVQDIANLLLRVVIWVSLPLSIFAAFFAQELSLVIFGNKWDGISAVVCFMSLVHGFSWIAGMNGEFYRAIGRPNIESIVTGVVLLLYAATYYWSVQYGLERFLFARVCLGFIALFLHFSVFKYVIGVGPIALLGKAMFPFFLSICVFGGSRLFSDLSGLHPYLAIGMGLLGLLVVTLVFFIFYGAKTRSEFKLINAWP